MDISIAWIVIILFGGVIILIGLRMWVGLALGAVGVAGLIYLVGAPQLIGDILWHGISSYTLAAVPLFIFMGEIVLGGGFSKRLYTGVSRWTGTIPGGLTHSNILSSALFAAISGSSVATVATIGTIAYPEQKKRGYNTRIVTGSLTAGGVLGPMIPPSIGMILYGATCNVSVGKLFAGTAIPGIIMALMFMTYIYIRFRLDPSLGPKAEPISWSYFGKAIGAFKDVWPVLLLIGLIFGGIYGGFMTPTEAAAVSGFVAMCLAAAFGSLTFNIVKEASIKALRTSAMIFLIMASAKVLGFTMSMLMIPKQLCAMVEASGLPPLAIWGFLILVYLFLGCFMDGISMFFLTIPVVFPMMMNLGYDPIWFGVILWKVLEVGLLTPPMGLNLYVCQGVTKAPFADIVRGSVAFFILIIVLVGLVTAFPQLATWLPSTMGR